MKKIALLLALVALPLHADLRSQITSQNGWAGYSVPIDGDHTLVCSWGDSTNITNGSYEREYSTALFVLYEVTEHRITGVRLSSPECPERERRVNNWLGPVDPRESVKLLVDLVENNPEVGKKAVTALALHQGTEEELIHIAKTHRMSKMRSSALFWVGQRAGVKAASVLKNAVDNDPDADVKTKAVFAISQLPNDRSIPMLVELMTTHKSREVRKKAAFWLGQKDDPRALEALERVLLK